MPGEKDMNYDIKLFDNMELTYDLRADCTLR